MSEILLETNNLTKIFKKNTAVKGVNLRVRKNTVYGMLGPNGAGKSTTLKMLTGILTPTKGEIFFDGHKWSRNDLWKISALIENPPLYDNLTAEENLLVQVSALGLEKSRIPEVLRIVGLKNTGKKRVKEFSLGMKQRLGIALSLLNEPGLLILDEPTNGLDPLGIQELRQLIRSFTEHGITVILSSHILSEVEQIADDIGIIMDGELRYQEANHQGQNLEQLFLDIVKEGEKSHA